MSNYFCCRIQPRKDLGVYDAERDLSAIAKFRVCLSAKQNKADSIKLDRTHHADWFIFCSFFVNFLFCFGVVD